MTEVRNITVALVKAATATLLILLGMWILLGAVVIR